MGVQASGCFYSMASLADKTRDYWILASYRRDRLPDGFKGAPATIGKALRLVHNIMNFTDPSRPLMKHVVPIADELVNGTKAKDGAA